MKTDKQFIDEIYKKYAIICRNCKKIEERKKTNG